MDAFYKVIYLKNNKNEELLYSFFKNYSKDDYFFLNAIIETLDDYDQDKIKTNKYFKIFIDKILNEDPPIWHKLLNYISNEKLEKHIFNKELLFDKKTASKAIEWLLSNGTEFEKITNYYIKNFNKLSVEDMCFVINFFIENDLVFDNDLSKLFLKKTLKTFSSIPNKETIDLIFQTINKVDIDFSDYSFENDNPIKNFLIKLIQNNKIDYIIQFYEKYNLDNFFVLVLRHYGSYQILDLCNYLINHNFPFEIYQEDFLNFIKIKLSIISLIDLLIILHKIYNKNKTLVAKIISLSLVIEEYWYDSNFLNENDNWNNIFELYNMDSRIKSLFDSIISDQINPELSLNLKILIRDENFYQNDLDKISDFKLSNKVQSLFIRYASFMIKDEKIPKQCLYEILDKFKFQDLGSLMIKICIENKFTDLKQLMHELNVTLKRHFLILQDENYNESDFDSDFNLGNFLPTCMGRTQVKKVKSWKGHGQSRWYVPSNNIEIERIYSQPCKYCEGTFWKKEYFYNSQTNRKITQPFNVYWCRGNTCFELSTKPDYSKPQNVWTLVEILDILTIKIDLIFLSKLGGWANRMLEIFHKLRCRECNQILRPFAFKPQTLGYYSVPLFHCVNPDCKEYNNKIRFTHCLNGRCGNMLDSRDCDKCSNGWLICNNCGSCCPEHSNKTFEKKYINYDDYNNI
ncbi:hypothetical protein D4R71_04340 [bacterium]|nr:MAG: hypothetical protein D4R71_04340 [bacterium]